MLDGPSLVGRKLLAVTERLDLSVFKDISKVYDCTTNDIFMSCIARAVKTVDPTILKTQISYI